MDQQDLSMESVSPDKKLFGDLFGWRSGTKKGRVPNIADSASNSSVAIATEMFNILNVSRESSEKGQTLGSRLESAIQSLISDELPEADPSRTWVVGSDFISGFSQYKHLAQLDEVIEADQTNTLSVEIGRDYVVKPDVTVGLMHGLTAEKPMLHAAISCKFTIRSDRVQNIRHEGVILTRHRRGRQPHIVTVTCEPLPTRLAAIARGTGEVDGVYHAAFPELKLAVQAEGKDEQRQALDEIISQHRLFDLDDLVPTLIY